MSEITELKLWKDPGFTDGCVEVPAYENVDVLPDADLTLDDGLNPSKGRMFSEIRISRTYAEIQNMSYLKLTVSYNNDEDARVYYGFIDSVAIVSDTENFPAVNISFHVDLWRTYLKDAEFGYGMVTRRPVSATYKSGNYPMQNIPYSNILASTAHYIFREDSLAYSRYVKKFTYNAKEYDVYWIYIAWAYESADNRTVTQTFTLLPLPILNYQPINLDSLWLAPKESTVSDMKVADLFSSDYLTHLGIAPSSITSAFVSPLCPYSNATVEVGSVYDSSGTQHLCLKYDITGRPAVYRVTEETHTYIYPYFQCVFIRILPETVDYFDDLHHMVNIEADEKNTLVVCDFKGLKVGTIPPRLPLAGQGVRPVCTPTRFYWEISFILTNPLGPADLYEYRKQNGLYFEINCPTWSISSNSWSEYVVSQARETEIANRKLSNEMAVYGGMSQAVTGAVSGYSMGAISDSTRRGKYATKATMNKAGILAGIGAIGQVTSSLTEYAVASEYADDLQELSDRSNAGQIDSLISGGDDIVWITECELPQVIALSKDTYSCDVYDQQIALNGVSVSEPTEDCTDLIHGTGPLSIENLIVRGEIPVEAKQYIKARLNNGVRLI